MQHLPPQLFHRFFRWFCHPELLPTIEGDLMELYAQRLRANGKGRADWKFVMDVVLLFRPGIIRPPQRIVNTNYMWKNYLTIAWRNIRKNRGYSLINIGGLSIGMTVAIFLGLSIYYELSFDGYHPNYDRTARVMQHQTNNGEISTHTNLPYPLANELREKYGDSFESVVMSTRVGGYVVTVDDQGVEKQGAYFEPGGPAMIGLHMLKGSGDALNDKASILLSESAARSLFGDGEALGRTLKLEGADMKVAGIYADLPVNSTFEGLQFMAPWQLMFDSEGLKDWEDPWRPNAFAIWVRLSPGTDPSNLSTLIKDALLKNLSESLALKKNQVFLHPMKDWHLRSEFKNGVNIGGAIRYVWLFGLIGGFVLLLACINFMNLSTAQSERRSREVGIRKSMGSVRGQLVIQFFLEAILVSSVALLIALMLVQLLLPAFNLLVSKQVDVPWLDWRFLIIAAGSAIFIGILAGAYPALVLSSFKPINVLKGPFTSGQTAGLPRKVLVVVQFSVSVTLIIGTWVVTEQINFGKSRPVGYSREGLVTVPMVSGKLRQHMDAFREEVMKEGEVISMARTTNPTTYTGNSSSRFDWKGKDPGLSVDFPYVMVSHDYGSTVGWKFAAGRDFSRDYASDTAAMVLNEAAAKYLGFKDPIGETIRWRDVPMTIIGVIEDVVMDSPYEPVRPTVFALTPSGGYLITARIRPGAEAASALATIERVYKKYAPGDPFYYNFVDEEYAAKFGHEEKILRLTGVLSGLAIFISCLGIFGLSSFVVERRTKEVGIRKVMGANVAGLWQLLSKDFVLLVAISFALAFPLAAYFTGEWLSQYNYHISVQWWVYAASGGLAIAITLATVSYHTLRAAASNPVNSLRAE